MFSIMIYNTSKFCFSFGCWLVFDRFLVNPLQKLRLIPYSLSNIYVSLSRSSPPLTAPPPLKGNIYSDSYKRFEYHRVSTHI